MEKKIVRVSVGNLAWFVSRSIVGHDAFAVKNPKKQGYVMALGGGAMLTEEGKKVLEKRFGAFDFELDEETGFYDARFKIDEVHLQEVFKIFAGNTDRMEKDRTLDILAELTKKDFGGASILSQEDVAQVSVAPITTVRQAPSQHDTSARASAEVETRRLFRIFCLDMPDEVREKFMTSPFVVPLSREERATTQHGAKAGRTRDGFVMQNNLFLPA